MSKPLLSIGMIVKNEERSLEKCLKALEPIRKAIPSELIIADTGSTDKTVEIAKKYADEVFYFEWINDFSAARNAVIEKCSADWFMAVDADEYFNSGVDELVTFLNSELHKTAVLATFVQRNFRNSNMQGEYADFNASRIVHISLGLRYTGSIHESIETDNIKDGGIIVLPNLIFDHDGYTALTPTSIKEKEERNLKLLEKELEKDPQSYRRILQCLESATVDASKRKYFIEYAVKTLKDTNFKEENQVFFLPMLLRQIVLYGVADKNPDVEEYMEWGFKYCPNSPHIYVDVAFSKAENFAVKEDYKNALSAAKEYLKNVEKYLKSKNKDINISSPLEKIHEIYQYQAKMIMALSMVKLNRIDEALKILKQPSKYFFNTKIFSYPLIALTEIYDNKEAKSIIKKNVDALLKSKKDDSISDITEFNNAIALIARCFNFNEENKNKYKLFTEVSGTIGISAKILDSSSKSEIEKYLSEIDDFDFFMPATLKKVIELKAKLPESFYKIPHQKMTSLISTILPKIKDINEQLIEDYLNPEKIEFYHELSFAYNFLLSIILNDNITLSNKEKIAYTNAFGKISSTFLNMTYSEQILIDDESFDILPNSVVFSRYFAKAFSLKTNNPLEYIRTLRVIIQKFPQSKEIIKFLIDNLNKEEEERKKQNMRANPELMAMAEQLKIMLKALPEGSPQLEAIKQSPMYKQVAHLIEE